MTSTIPTKEGYVPFHGYKTWYRIEGEREEPGRFPLLVLHGGPGATRAPFSPDYPLSRTGAGGTFPRLAGLRPAVADFPG